jgi:hypothetical protein
LHIGILPLRIVLLSALLGPCVVGAQSPAPSEVATRPVIIGSLDKGKYSNPMIGFELQLDAPCAFADEDRAIAWSTQFSQRLNLSIRCGDNLVLLSSLPLHADEKVDLRRDAQVSLEGAMGGFKRRGHWQNHTIGETEILVQELIRHGDSGQELGFYQAFMVGRRYVSILAIGPEANKAAPSQAAANLKIEARPAP